ncbi:hypothetical protein FACS189420_7070 [Bacteroidia bacterium]|nr:hypothetical protein FACS189420_7070 [Bacteroidia bacterium]
MQKLPIGIQSFVNLRNDDCLYVDKTEDIHKMITSGRVFFLSRPRRFGKSLLVSTMEAIFKGKKELFKGLWIEDNWDWTVQHPVIRLDFGGINNDTPENLQKDLEDVLFLMAKEHGITLTRTGSGRFSELIEQLHKITGQQVVVLIDEYDKPIVDHLNNDNLAAANREVLKSFYQLLKEHNDVKSLLEPIRMQAANFDSFDIQAIDPQVLMFQTGYLTIKKKEKDPFDDVMLYTLGVPNEEVNKALTTHLFASYTETSLSKVGMVRSQMMGQLLQGEPQAFERSLQALFAHIPYQLWGADEKYYHSLLLLWLNLLGFKIEAEVSTDKGRIDAVWTWKERVVVAEIKYAAEGNTDTLLDAAPAQIHERRYYERYAGENKCIALLGIAFAGKEIACRMVEIR